MYYSFKLILEEPILHEDAEVAVSSDFALKNGVLSLKVIAMNT